MPQFIVNSVITQSDHRPQQKYYLPHTNTDLLHHNEREKQTRMAIQMPTTAAVTYNEIAASIAEQISVVRVCRGSGGELMP